MIRKAMLIGAAVCLPASLLADFSYDSTTKVTGGMLAGMMKFAGAFSKQAREPIQSTAAVKGNKMVNLRKDHASIIDVDAETITEVDFQKKTYSVMTFAQMKEMLEQVSQQMSGKHTDDKGNSVTTDFKVDVKPSDETRQIAGFEAKKLTMTMQMDATDDKTGKKGSMYVATDLWLAAGVPGYDEVRAFHKKMAQKLDWSPDGGNMTMGRPDIARGMSAVYKEAGKMDGVPVLTVMKMTPLADGQTAPPASSSDTQTSSSQAKPQPKPSLSDALGGKFGGFGGFGRKKKQEPAAESSSSTPPAQSGDASGALIEMTTEMTNFSSAAVDPAKFSVPAGFKQVEPEMNRRQRK